MAKRKRDVPVLFWVSAEELELIHQKMQQQLEPADPQSA